MLRGCRILSRAISERNGLVVEREAGDCQYRERSSPHEPAFSSWGEGSDRLGLVLPSPIANSQSPIALPYPIRSTHCAREAGAAKGSAKYWVSRATLSSLNSM